jgi:hypothetical protein
MLSLSLLSLLSVEGAGRLWDVADAAAGGSEDAAEDITTSR